MSDTEQERERVEQPTTQAQLVTQIIENAQDMRNPCERHCHCSTYLEALARQHCAHSNWLERCRY